jgi:hypothetical protein
MEIITNGTQIRWKMKPIVLEKRVMKYPVKDWLFERKVNQGIYVYRTEKDEGYCYWRCRNVQKSYQA